MQDNSANYLYKKFQKLQNKKDYIQFAEQYQILIPDNLQTKLKIKNYILDELSQIIVKEIEIILVEHDIDTSNNSIIYKDMNNILYDENGKIYEK